MPTMDPFEVANAAHREIDALGAAKANPGRAVHSIEGGVNRMTNRPPVPPSARLKSPAPKSPFKPGQKVKGFGNLEGMRRAGLKPPGPEDVKKYVEDPNHEVLVSKGLGNLMERAFKPLAEHGSKGARVARNPALEHLDAARNAHDPFHPSYRGRSGGTPSYAMPKKKVRPLPQPADVSHLDGRPRSGAGPHGTLNGPAAGHHQQFTLGY